MQCDLCGALAHELLIEVPTGRSMRSDRAILPRDLVKHACTRCGLVSGDAQIAEGLYAESYTVGLQPEHMFYGANGPIARSAVMADWLTPSIPARAQDIFEIGAGSGNLLAELARRLPDRKLAGTEPNHLAAARAQQRGLTVSAAALEATPARYDLAYAIAVIEHVPSPTTFLRAIRAMLRDEGTLLLCQPTQDVPSTDVFFADHLHHFGTEHLRQYAHKCGFREQQALVGHPLMPNFSLHVWQACAPPDDFSWIGPPAMTTCRATAAAVVADMQRLDALLARLAHERRRVAVFGLGEVYWLARSYSKLGDFPVVVGLDDDPNRPGLATLGFPVAVPEQCALLGVQDVILTMSSMYHAQATKRLHGLGLGIAVHELLSHA